jgi:hypothetical protein
MTLGLWDGRGMIPILRAYFGTGVDKEFARGCFALPCGAGFYSCLNMNLMIFSRIVSIFMDVLPVTFSLWHL